MFVWIGNEAQEEEKTEAMASGEQIWGERTMPCGIGDEKYHWDNRKLTNTTSIIRSKKLKLNQKTECIYLKDIIITDTYINSKVLHN